ncbi:alpha/beta hydrolase family protein [Roseateles sp.]|uniref:alpha/beta hydrolase family protein n=1 Tax=Roseateles sp. TaxID=1971397 RepID=UPI003943CD7C
MPFPRQLVFVAALLIAASGGWRDSRAAPPEGFSFRAVTAADLAQVQAVWAQRDLSPRDVSVAHESEEDGRRVRIYRHRVGANIHYGAVVTPVHATHKLPVVVMLDGLNQTRPWLDLEKKLVDFKGNTVWVVPGFRGRELRYKGKSFGSQGDFCDAYDGATDDAIALTQVAIAQTPHASAKALAIGWSRGGNVAMMMGMRDSHVDTVVAAAGPMDFNREEVAERYGAQYECQYFAGRHADASRLRILASSPLHFRLPPGVKVHLMQGGADDIVPPWNAIEMKQRLQAQNADVTLDLYPGGTHATTFGSASFQQRWHHYLQGFIRRPAARSSSPG